MPKNPTGFDHIVVAVHDLEAAAARYTQLGFTLTPRAEHPWGTANHIAQFSNGSFIELLEVDRPHLLSEHAFAASPARFSFGAHNRDFLEAGHQAIAAEGAPGAEGMSMMVYKGEDASADARAFAASGLPTYETFPFERATTLPDGTPARVAFELAFATHPAMPRAAFFTCHNKFPDVFWKPAFQTHANSATGLREVVMAATAPSDYADFAQAVTGVPAQAHDGGIACVHDGQTLSILTPDATAARFDGLAPDLDRGPVFCAIVIDVADAPTNASRALIPAEAAHGLAIAWNG